MKTVYETTLALHDTRGMKVIDEHMIRIMFSFSPIDYTDWELLRELKNKKVTLLTISILPSGFNFRVENSINHPVQWKNKETWWYTYNTRHYGNNYSTLDLIYVTIHTFTVMLKTGNYPRVIIIKANKWT